MRTQGPRSGVKYVMLIENRWFCVCVRGMQSKSAALWGLLATLEVTGWKEFTNNWILTASARGNGNNHTYPRTHLLRIILRVLFRVFERRVTFRIAGTICYFQYSAPVGGWEGGWRGCLHKSSPSRDTVCWSWPRKVNFSLRALNLQKAQLVNSRGALGARAPPRGQNKKKRLVAQTGSADAALGASGHRARWEMCVFPTSFLSLHRNL